MVFVDKTFPKTFKILIMVWMVDKKFQKVHGRHPGGYEPTTIPNKFR